jgi:predicted ATPase/DNA-binding winged helix-turn-helix (wHTH) protein
MSSGTPAEYRFDRFHLCPGERQLLEGDRPVKLGARAFDILVMLVQERDRAVPKGELMERVWPRLIVEENNLQVQIAALRKILGQAAIATIPGRGYQFTPRLEYAAEALTQGRSPRKNNLPRPLTSFVGREHDLTELAKLLQTTRLLTLTGIGGCGKTRLAIKLAEVVMPSFSNGVCFVDFAPITEPGHVALRVAGAFGVREETDKPIEDTLIRHLAEQQVLLILDNCEHLLSACAALAERLLITTAGLRVLVTSREGFGIAGERVVPVRSLSLPSRVADDVQTLLASEAVRLFVDRAKELAPEFDLTPRNAAAVFEICHRLDGIPLALELAAARVKLLSVEQIRAKLDDRFRFLTGSARAVSRHQTLLVTLQWSYEHLTPDEQRWFRRMSVFVGGWTLDAVVDVVAEGCDEVETLERLGRLVDQSLVLVERNTAEEPRYRMLETVRQYAEDRLNESGESNTVRERHLAHFLALVKRAHPNFFSKDANAWYRRLDRELSNLLAAHAWCDRAADGAALGLELASNVRMYWIERGLFALGHQVYVQALARDGAEQRSAQRGRALFAFGQHQNFCGRFADGIAPLEEGLAIARELRDDQYAAHCLDKIAYTRGFMGDAVTALACVDEELVIRRRLGGPHLTVSALITKAAILRMKGDFDAAALVLEEALSLSEGDDLEELHVIRSDLARVSIARGSLRHARVSLIEAINLLLRTNSRFRSMVALDVAALLAAACRDWQRAARLQCVFDTTLAQFGGFQNPYDDRVLAELRQKPRTKLGTESYAAAYEAGRHLGLEHALSETLAWLKQESATDQR